MSPSDDYRDNVSKTEFVDQDVERLITGRSPVDSTLDELTPWIEALRSEGSFVPSSEASEQFAVSAAAVVRSGQPKALGIETTENIARPDRRPSWRLPRAAFAISGFALLIVAVTLGLVAHTSVPGDPLYGVDLAMEHLGLGDGRVDERIVEADALVSAGDQIEALVLLGTTYERAATDGDMAGAERAERRITSVSTTGNITASLQTKIERLRQFMAENAGPGVGLDGEEFERALEDIVRQDP